MPPESTIAEADPLAEAAKFFASTEPAASPPPESPPSDAAPVVVPAKDGDEAPKGEAGAAAAESPPEEATKAEDEDGADEDATGIEALRAAVSKDPALALVPQIRTRLGLPALEAEAKPAAAPPAGPVPVSFTQSDEEFAKATAAKYEEKFEKGDDVGAVIGVADAVSKRNASRAVAEAMPHIYGAIRKQLLSEARDGQIVEAFVTGNPEWKGKEKEVYGRVLELRKRADVDGLPDHKVLMLLDSRPSKSVAEAAGAALQKAAAAKRAAAASAAAAPANQRPAGIPAPTKEPGSLEKAAATLITKGAQDVGSLLYDVSKVKRK